MPYVTCQKCHTEQLAPRELEGLTHTCKRCGRDVPVCSEPIGSSRPARKRSSANSYSLSALLVVAGTCLFGGCIAGGVVGAALASLEATDAKSRWSSAASAPTQKQIEAAVLGKSLRELIADYGPPADTITRDVRTGQTFPYTLYVFRMAVTKDNGSVNLNEQVLVKVVNDRATEVRW